MMTAVHLAVYLAIYGVTRMVNLTSDAERFITTIVRGRGKLKTLDFTGGVRPLKEPPVKAKIYPPIYGAGCNYTETSKNEKCKDVLTWYIGKGIVSPLNLSVNVNVRLIGKSRNVTVALNFNGASNLTWSSVNGKPIKRMMLQGVVKQQCNYNFSAMTTFSGYIAYHLGDVRGDTPKYDAFNITDLKNHTEGLEVQGDMLTYNVTGIFRHELVCKGKKAPR